MGINRIARGVLPEHAVVKRLAGRASGLRPPERQEDRREQNQALLYRQPSEPPTHLQHLS
jgi:hypothetical protein